MRTDLIQNTIQNLKQNRPKAVLRKASVTSTVAYLRGYGFAQDAGFDAGVKKGPGYLYRTDPDAHRVLIGPLSENRDALFTRRVSA